MSASLVSAPCSARFYHRKPCIQPNAPRLQCMRVLNRRGFGIHFILIPMLVNSSSSNTAVASEIETRRADSDSWDEYVGDGFAVKVPPGFEDTIEPDEYPAGEAPLYGYQRKNKIFAARFASKDGEEFVSVVIRRSSQLKPTFFAAQNITDLGNVNDIAKILLPVGAKVAAASSISSEDKRVYYLYEYLAGNKHGFVSAAAKNGQVFVAAATAPLSKWNEDGPMLSSAAASFSLL